MVYPLLQSLYHTLAQQLRLRTTYESCKTTLALPVGIERLAPKMRLETHQTDLFETQINLLNLVG